MDNRFPLGFNAVAADLANENFIYDATLVGTKESLPTVDWGL